MARSKYVYIVQNKSEDGGYARAAFTVKHECVSYLEKARATGEPLSWWTVVRMPDGKETAGDEIIARASDWLDGATS